MIVPVEPTAASLLAALHASAFADPWDAGAFSALLAAPGAFALACEEGEAPAGFVLARVAADEAEILTLAVLPARRRHGVGRALVKATAARVGLLGARALLLEVAEDNATARQLYAALGFRQVGRRDGYYARPGATAAAALVLKLDLPRV